MAADHFLVDRILTSTSAERVAVHPGRSWSLAAILSRSRQVLARQGLRALWFKILGETCYRRARLYKEILANDLHLPAASVPLAVRTLTREDLPRYLRDVPSTNRREIVARLEGGHICHAAWSNGELLGYVWSAPGRAPIDYLGIALHLPESAVYGYEIFVRPDCRKLGVSVAMIRERRLLLLNEGYETGYSVLMPENTPAVGFQRAVKRIPIGMIRIAWLGPFRRAWTAMGDAGAAPPFGVSLLDL